MRMAANGCRPPRCRCGAATRSTRRKCSRAKPRSSDCSRKCRPTSCSRSCVACRPRGQPPPETALMELRAAQLAGHLERTLAPVYVVQGDEPLLALEAADAIRAAARNAGCDEREILIVEQG